MIINFVVKNEAMRNKKMIKQYEKMLSVLKQEQKVIKKILEGLV